MLSKFFISRILYLLLQENYKYFKLKFLKFINISLTNSLRYFTVAIQFLAWVYLNSTGFVVIVSKKISIVILNFKKLIIGYCNVHFLFDLHLDWISVEI